MLDFQKLLNDELQPFEGQIAWLYLDSHHPPLPTVSRGCALTGVEESLTLPWLVDGRPANEMQIRLAWAKVSAMPGGKVARFYRFPNCPELSQQAMDALVQKRFDDFTTELTEIFPDFMQWPIQAKAATLDMMYGLGRSKFVGEYPLFRAAATRHDWKTCAAQCAMNASDKAYDKRNQWLRLMFLQAAGK